MTDRTNRTDPSERVTSDNKQREEGGRDAIVRASEKKTRRSKLEHIDQFYVDPKEIPDGFTIEWKRMSIYGKEDREHLIELERDGWEPASPKDFPSLVGKNHTDSTIILKDLVLMIRPTELTKEAYHEDKYNANNQVKTKLEEIGMSKQGEAPRVDGHGRSMAKVARNYDKISVE